MGEYCKYHVTREPAEGSAKKQKQTQFAAVAEAAHLLLTSASPGRRGKALESLAPSSAATTNSSQGAALFASAEALLQKENKLPGGPAKREVLNSERRASASSARSAPKTRHRSLRCKTNPLRRCEASVSATQSSPDKSLLFAELLQVLL